MNTPPRFYVREHTGLRAMMTGGHSRPHTEVMVIDRDYCHRVVRSYNDGARGGDVRRYQMRRFDLEGCWTPLLEARRRVAAALCDEMNLEAAREPVSC